MRLQKVPNISRGERMIVRTLNMCGFLNFKIQIPRKKENISLKKDAIVIINLFGSHNIEKIIQI
jgi:hypothetical protein